MKKNIRKQTPPREMRRDRVISSDTLTHSSKQNSLEFTIESVHFNKDDSYVGFYVLCILWWHSRRPIL